MAPKKGSKKAPVFTYDYSGIQKGMSVQAESEGEYYLAEVVQVSTSKNRSKAPVKVNFKGYDESYDIWVGGDRLRSKALKKVTPEATAKSEKKPLEFNFGYWKIRGLGAVFRMIFEYKGVKYTDNAYADTEKWFKEDKPKILEKNPLANLPYLECGNDCVCQTNAILIYLGNKLRLGGLGYKSRIKNEELLCEVYDTRNNMMGVVYPFNEVCRTEDEHKAKAGKVIENKPFTKFEAVLEKADTDYFCGKSPCTSDFHIWEMLDQYKLLAERYGKGDIFEGIPKCKAFYDRFRALPTLQKYFESDAYKFEINNSGVGAYFF
jgi:glutathione S-transferase